MDSLTQALYGATVQGALLGRQQGRRSLLYGAALGTLPDLDVVIRYADPISSMTYHRGFSHSVFVLTAFSILLAWLVRKWRPSPHYTGARLAFTIWAVLITHVLLDAFTTYGTQILWPFMATPTAWSNLFIIDPVFTLPLVAGVAAAALFWRRPMSTRGPTLALGFTTVYLAFTFMSQAVVAQQVRAAFTSRGLPVQRLHISSAPLNSVMWRVMVEDGQGRYHEGFASLLDPDTAALTPARAGAPPRFATFNQGTDLRQELVTQAGPHALLERLRWFSDDWLRYDDVDGKLVVTDLRMGLAGRHFFRFVVAERQADGRWQAVTPREWPGLRGGRDELTLVMQRIWNADLALPLAMWERDMRRAWHAGDTP